jgi:hypothetical protein
MCGETAVTTSKRGPAEAGRFVRAQPLPAVAGGGGCARVDVRLMTAAEDHVALLLNERTTLRTSQGLERPQTAGRR